MKKERKRLSCADIPRLESGKRERIRIHLWEESDSQTRRESVQRRISVVRPWIIVLLLLGIMAVCAYMLVFERARPQGPSEESSESVSNDVGSSESESFNTAESTSQESTESPESSADTETSKPAGLYDFDYSAIPEGSNAIIPVDLSLISYGDLYVNNSTGYAPDLSELLYAELGSGEKLESLSSGAPLVLVLHTHGTEAYSPRDATYYTEDQTELARSHDPKESVIAAGRVLVDVLNKAGISTVHSTVLHDSVQYKDAYARSAETVKKYLEMYPSIKLVIDLHRDSIVNSRGDILRTVTLAEGERCAQIKCTVGSSWSGEEYANWEKNLSLALKLRKLLNDKYVNICRPIDLKESTYNQELSPYSIFVEIGSSGNSLDEAMYASELLAKALVELIKMM